jgi:hypothetical protein
MALERIPARRVRVIVNTDAKNEDFFAKLTAFTQRSQHEGPR